MEPARLERPPFADLDQMPLDLLALVMAALEAMSRHPEIRRVRHTAWEALRPGPGQRLLDAGCGAGDVARQLAAAVAPDGEVVAVDRSGASLAVARDRQHDGNVRYAVGDVCALDFNDNSFDGAWCERVLQHVDDADRAIGELIRVTRPGGRVCLLDTDWSSLAFDGVKGALADEVLRHAHGRLIPQQRDLGRTLRRRVVGHGLTNVEATPVTCYFPDPASAAVVLPMVNPAVPVHTWAVPPALWSAWLDDIDAASKRGDFLAVLTIWVVAAEVM